MTNEQLADFIKEGGNDELIPVLWEKTRKLLYVFVGRYFSEHRDTMERCGITLPDLKQECYCVFADALKAYDKNKGYNFGAYFKYPFINTVKRLTNGRDSLNTAKSINEPVEYENDTAELADLFHDEHSLDFTEKLETESICNVVNKAVSELPTDEHNLISEHYYQNKTLKNISENSRKSIYEINRLKANAIFHLMCNKDIRRLKDELHYTSYRSYHNSYSGFARNGISNVEIIAISRADYYEAKQK